VGRRTSGAKVAAMYLRATEFELDCKKMGILVKSVGEKNSVVTITLSVGHFTQDEEDEFSTDETENENLETGRQ
jgi:hypothetical protein